MVFCVDLTWNDPTLCAKQVLPLQKHIDLHASMLNFLAKNLKIHSIKTFKSIIQWRGV